MKTFKKVSVETIIFWSFLLSNISAQYIWPIDGKILLNSNFAECRPNHFHAGLDINAKEGIPVRATSVGEIWHIRVSPFGYGKSLFLKLKDGKIVVYAHLQRFNEHIENLVEREQQRKFSYSISLYFRKGQLKVKKGEIVGYVGRTGAKGAHLHFEMRDSLNRPINPLKYGYKVIDTTRPLIKAVQLTPLDDMSFINGIPFPVIIKLNYNGNYYTYKDTINVSGKIGFEVLAEDYQNNYSVRLNVEKTEMYINGNLFFSGEYNRFSYEHTREVELEFDYDLYNRGIGRFHKLYIYGDNHLPFYREGNGIISSERLKDVNEIKIVCYDANKNRSVAILYLRRKREDGVFKKNPFPDSLNRKIGLDFYKNLVRVSVPDTEKIRIIKIKNLTPVKVDLEKQSNVSFFRLLPKKEAVCFLRIRHSNKTQNFKLYYNTILKNEGGNITSQDRQFIVMIEKGSICDDLYAKVRKIKEGIPEGLKLLKGVYIVEPLGDVFQKEITFLFPYHKTSTKRAGIYMKQKDEWLYLGGEYDEIKRAIVAKSWHLGTFALLEDNIPPQITDFRIVKEGNKIKKISFTVKERGSGFKTADIHISIDGIPYIPVYDPFRDEVSFLLFGKKIEGGGHTAEIMVTDRAGNRSSLSVSF